MFVDARCAHHTSGWLIEAEFSIYTHGPLARYVKLQVRMRRESRERFPRHWLQSKKKTLVSDPGTHHGTCVTHVPWCMSGSLTRGGGENVPGIPGACATHDFTYLARDPCINFTIICSDNGMSLVQFQAIICINDCLLVTGTLGTNLTEIWIRIPQFWCKKCIWKCRLQNCLSLIVLKRGTDATVIMREKTLWASTYNSYHDIYTYYNLAINTKIQW